MTDKRAYKAWDDAAGVWVTLGWYEHARDAWDTADETIGHDDYALYTLAPTPTPACLSDHSDDDHCRANIEGQLVEEYRDRGDGEMELVLSNGTIVSEDGVWWPDTDDDAEEA